MQLSNIDSDRLESLSTKDAIHVLQAIESRFSKHDKIFVNSVIQFSDKKNNLMLNIEICVQAFKGKESERFVGYTSRAKDFSCSNGVSFKEFNEEDFAFELKFQKRFNSI